MNDNIEFEIVVNGKQAELEINKVDKAQNNLEKTVKKTNENIGTSWAGVGVKIAAAAASLAMITKQASDNQKAMFGLSAVTKDYIKQASELYAMNQTIIAGFVQTGKSAGMSGDEIAKMIDMAVALSRKYPHESVETFIDNLSMLNTTGEAQGYIVDILEQKWGAIDLKGKTLSEKMAVLEEATKGVNTEFNKTAGAKLDQTMQAIENEVSSLGDSLLSLLDSSGALWLFNKAVLFTSTGLQGLASMASLVKIGFKEIFGQDTSEDLKAFNEQLKNASETWDKFLGKVNESQGSVGITVKPDILRTARAREQKVIEDEAKKTAKTQSYAATTSLSSWVNYYEKIGDYQTAWAIKESQLRQEYIDATDEQFSKMASIAKKEYFDKLEKDADTTATKIQEVLDSAFGTGFADMLITGKASFKDFANSVIEDIARIIIKQQMAGMTSSLASGLTGIFGSLFSGSSSVSTLGEFNLLTRSAKGNVFSNGSVQRFAQGGVLNRPTRLANGGALAGEKGSEAVMPLTRTSSGDLGVKAVGGGGVVINVENNTSTPITADMISSMKQDDTQVINIVMSAVATNKNGMRDMLKQVGR